MSSATALVTGASRGIGRAIACELGRASLTVGVNYRTREDEAKETCRAIEDAGGDAYLVHGDVGDPVDVTRMFEEFEAAAGPVSVLVNNAGIRSDGLAVKMSDTAWDEVMRTNLSGAFFCSRRALRSMLAQRRGRIVNVSSVAGLRASPGQANYAAAKAGLIGLTKTLAAEVASRGITVNAIAPGLVETELTADLIGTQRERLMSGTPMGRPATVSDVARTVAFLASDAASYITGSVITIDGGMSA